jgi:hypothetical protein
MGRKDSEPNGNVHSVHWINFIIYAVRFAGVFNRYLNSAAVLENLLTNKLHWFVVHSVHATCTYHQVLSVFTNIPNSLVATNKSCSIKCSRQRAASRCQSSSNFQGLTASPWWSGWSRSLKLWRTSKPWRGCLSENILLNYVAAKSSKTDKSCFFFIFSRFSPNKWTLLAQISSWCVHIPPIYLCLLNSIV